jgi:FkbM family methyltransferase
MPDGGRTTWDASGQREKPTVFSTKTKLAAAKVAYKGVTALRKAMGLSNHVEVNRKGITWRLDLGEGIDLSIYLLGLFEWSTVSAYRRLVRPDDVVLDIGANIGAHTLHFARCVGPGGKVVAFEPTAFAFHKLVTNVGLNPTLSPRILTEQIMLADQPGAGLVPGIYSSWPLANQSDLHSKHGGRLMGTAGASIASLDEYLDRAEIKRVHLVKMDIDGYECLVLRGGMTTLKRERPLIIMELAPYVLAETGHSLEELLDILGTLEYTLTALRSGQPLPTNPRVLRELIPSGCSINVIAKPE